MELKTITWGFGVLYIDCIYLKEFHQSFLHLSILLDVIRAAFYSWLIKHGIFCYKHPNLDTNIQFLECVFEGGINLLLQKDGSTFASLCKGSVKSFLVILALVRPTA